MVGPICHREGYFDTAAGLVSYPLEIGLREMQLDGMPSSGDLIVILLGRRFAEAAAAAAMSDR
jgi:hypothetical protein